MGDVKDSRQAFILVRQRVLDALVAFEASSDVAINSWILNGDTDSAIADRKAASKDFNDLWDLVPRLDGSWTDYISAVEEWAQERHEADLDGGR